MSILRPVLEFLGAIVGVDPDGWPKGDEDALREYADRYEAIAAGLRGEVGTRARQAAGSLAVAWNGEGGRAIANQIALYVSREEMGGVEAVAKSAESMAQYLRDQADTIARTKQMIVAQAVIGALLFLVPSARIASQLVKKALIKRFRDWLAKKSEEALRKGLMQAAKNAVKLPSVTVKTLLPGAVTGALGAGLFGLGPNTYAQAYGRLTGQDGRGEFGKDGKYVHGEGWNWDDTEKYGLITAWATPIAGVAGLGASVVGKVAVDRFGSTEGANWLGRRARGAVSMGVGMPAADKIVTGHDPSLEDVGRAALMGAAMPSHHPARPDGMDGMGPHPDAEPVRSHSTIDGSGDPPLDPPQLAVQPRAMAGEAPAGRPTGTPATPGTQVTAPGIMQPGVSAVEGQGAAGARVGGRPADAGAASRAQGRPPTAADGSSAAPHKPAAASGSGDGGGPPGGPSARAEAGEAKSGAEQRPPASVGEGPADTAGSGTAEPDGKAEVAGQDEVVPVRQAPVASGVRAEAPPPDGPTRVFPPERSPFDRPPGAVPERRAEPLPEERPRVFPPERSDPPPKEWPEFPVPPAPERPPVSPDGPVSPPERSPFDRPPSIHDAAGHEVLVAKTKDPISLPLTDGKAVELARENEVVRDRDTDVAIVYREVKDQKGGRLAEPRTFVRAADGTWTETATPVRSATYEAWLASANRDHETAKTLYDIAARSDSTVPVHLRLENLGVEALRDLLLHGTPEDAVAAIYEVVRRYPDEGVALRWTQLAASKALADGNVVNMAAGEGKSWVFLVAAARQAVRDGVDAVLVVTTRRNLADRESKRYERLLEPFGFDIHRMDPDQMPPTPRDGRPTIYVGTHQDVAFSKLKTGLVPGQRESGETAIDVIIDEVDEAVVYSDTTYIISEGAGRLAPERVAAPVRAAGSFLAEKLADGQLTEADFGRQPGQLGGRAALTEAGQQKVEKILDRPLSEAERRNLDLAAAARWEVIKNVHYVVTRDDKIIIIDQVTHDLLYDPVTSTESRWNGGLAQAVEAHEGLPIRDDPTTSKQITAPELYSGGPFNRVTGGSGTALGKEEHFRRAGMSGEVAEIPRYYESRLIVEPDHVTPDLAAKLDEIADGVRDMQATGTKQPQLIIAHRNDLVAELAARLYERGVPHTAIDAKWFEAQGSNREAAFKAVLDSAGGLGDVLVINLQGARGVDISVSAEAKAAGGMHVRNTDRSSVSRDIDVQKESRAARSGDPGSAGYYISPDDAAFLLSPNKDVELAVVKYTDAEAADNAHPTAATRSALTDAEQGLRDLVPAIQADAAERQTAHTHTVVPHRQAPGAGGHRPDPAHDAPSRPQGRADGQAPGGRRPGSGRRHWRGALDLFGDRWMRPARPGDALAGMVRGGDHPQSPAHNEPSEPSEPNRPNGPNDNNDRNDVSAARDVAVNPATTTPTDDGSVDPEALQRLLAALPDVPGLDGTHEQQLTALRSFAAGSLGRHAADTRLESIGSESTGEFGASVLGVRDADGELVAVVKVHPRLDEFAEGLSAASLASGEPAGQLGSTEVLGAGVGYDGRTRLGVLIGSVAPGTSIVDLKRAAWTATDARKRAAAVSRWAHRQLTDPDSAIRRELRGLGVRQVTEPAPDTFRFRFTDGRFQDVVVAGGSMNGRTHLISHLEHGRTPVLTLSHELLEMDPEDVEAPAVRALRQGLRAALSEQADLAQFVEYVRQWWWTRNRALTDAETAAITAQLLRARPTPRNQALLLAIARDRVRELQTEIARAGEQGVEAAIDATQRQARFVARLLHGLDPDAPAPGFQQDIVEALVPRDSDGNPLRFSNADVWGPATNGALPGRERNCPAARAHVWTRYGRPTAAAPPARPDGVPFAAAELEQEFGGRFQQLVEVSGGTLSNDEGAIALRRLEQALEDSGHGATALLAHWPPGGGPGHAIVAEYNAGDTPAQLRGVSYFDWERDGRLRDHDDAGRPRLARPDLAGVATISAFVLDANQEAVPVRDETGTILGRGAGNLLLPTPVYASDSAAHRAWVRDLAAQLGQPEIDDLPLAGHADDLTAATQQAGALDGVPMSPLPLMPQVAEYFTARFREHGADDQLVDSEGNADPALIQQRLLAEYRQTASGEGEIIRIAGRYYRIELVLSDPKRVITSTTPVEGVSASFPQVGFMQDLGAIRTTSYLVDVDLPLGAAGAGTGLRRATPYVVVTTDGVHSGLAVTNNRGLAHPTEYLAGWVISEVDPTTGEPRATTEISVDEAGDPGSLLVAVPDSYQETIDPADTRRLEKGK
ncbi:WXG100-like domain-containing protein [Flindersiella endophytica]